MPGCKRKEIMHSEYRESFTLYQLFRLQVDENIINISTNEQLQTLEVQRFGDVVALRTFCQGQLKTTCDSSKASSNLMNRIREKQVSEAWIFPKRESQRFFLVMTNFDGMEFSDVNVTIEMLYEKSKQKKLRLYLRSTKKEESKIPMKMELPVEFHRPESNAERYIMRDIMTDFVPNMVLSSYAATSFERPKTVPDYNRRAAESNERQQTLSYRGSISMLQTLKI
ncbi:hypothetical protein CAPTEDRAFT_228257 [Capitella teleta]|uniref:Uncharacterized protein n=1 Tax=Capitella teleta TaxID=283909 RepID=R7TKT2_CAPTE|nr:hypothetical protein CAPTEDRAFT_228257 [Capitella teleta]|eukprot:ELT92161.1 hypothetical protein CAPTEDRAFT_228257 [Capitella teleta]